MRYPVYSETQFDVNHYDFLGVGLSQPVHHPGGVRVVGVAVGLFLHQPPRKVLNSPDGLSPCPGRSRGVQEVHVAPRVVQPVLAITLRPIDAPSLVRVLETRLIEGRPYNPSFGILP